MGSDKTIYFIHPGVLSACKSSSADVHVSGSWKDVGERAIDWTHFDEQTIECVLHYLYTGDYHVHVSGSENSVSITENGAEAIGQTGGE